MCLAWFVAVLICQDASFTGQFHVSLPNGMFCLQHPSGRFICQGLLESLHRNNNHLEFNAPISGKQVLSDTPSHHLFMLQSMSPNSNFQSHSLIRRDNGKFRHPLIARAIHRASDVTTFRDAKAYFVSPRQRIGTRSETPRKSNITVGPFSARLIPHMRCEWQDRQDRYSMGNGDMPFLLRLRHEYWGENGGLYLCGNGCVFIGAERAVVIEEQHINGMSREAGIRVVEDACIRSMRKSLIQKTTTYDASAVSSGNVSNITGSMFKLTGTGGLVRISTQMSQSRDELDVSSTCGDEVSIETPRCLKVLRTVQWAPLPPKLTRASKISPEASL
jgi:hypothetical protein